MNNTKVLIAIATYKEAENIKNLISEINYNNLVYMERSKKLGLGTAHKLSIFYAIKFNYNFLVTMGSYE